MFWHDCDYWQSSSKSGTGESRFEWSLLGKFLPHKYIVTSRGRTNCFRHFVKTVTKPAVKNSVPFAALEAKHLLERVGSVTDEVLKGANDYT